MRRFPGEGPGSTSREGDNHRYRLPIQMQKNEFQMCMKCLKLYQSVPEFLNHFADDCVDLKEETGSNYSLAHQTGASGNQLAWGGAGPSFPMVVPREESFSSGASGNQPALGAGPSFPMVVPKDEPLTLTGGSGNQSASEASPYFPMVVPKEEPLTLIGGASGAGSSFPMVVPKEEPLTLIGGVSGAGSSFPMVVPKEEPLNLIGASGGGGGPYSFPMVVPKVESLTLTGASGGAGRSFLMVVPEDEPSNLDLALSLPRTNRLSASDKGKGVDRIE